MRLKISKSKNVTLFYVIKSVYINGKQKTITVEKLGNENDVLKRSNGEDPIVWAKKYVEELNKKELENTRVVSIQKHQNKIIEKDLQNSFNVGYLFLEKIYYQLGINNITKDISSRHRFKFDLNSILSCLVFGRIIHPSSKLATAEFSRSLIEKPVFQLEQLYRSLSVIANEMDFIQAELYKNSLNIVDRNTSVLYYDCTNYFFEIEEADDEGELRQYGPSKEHRPNPISQMGMFMDADGLPLAFNVNPGNTNEQKTMTPLEEQIISDFKLSKFVVCTDAGLASKDNRLFNNHKDRAFITTQSIKKLKQHLKDWALDYSGWYLNGSNDIYNLSDILKDDDSINKYMNSTFFKERWINENGLEQKLIVTFSLKYKLYQENIRNSQLERAKKAVDNKDFKLNKSNQNDFKRFIKKTTITKDGEIATIDKYSIDYSVVANEEVFDGFYAVCTNLEDDASEIIKVNHRRWQIEECFRIMKSEFKARPVYLSRDDRIKAHFLICYIALLIYRILEKTLDEKYTVHQIIDCIKNMNVMQQVRLWLYSYLY